MPTINPFDINAPQVTAAQTTAAQANAAPAVQPTSAQTTSAGPAAQGTADLATAQEARVDPATQTVQGQLAGILASGNPLLVQAQTRAAQAANQRGLLNSSMAVQAGESALYDAAMPIASQDAATYGQFGLSNAERAQQAALANQAARNRMTETNVGEANTSARFNAAESNTGARFNAGETNQIAALNAQQAQQANMQNAQLTQQANMQNAQLTQQAGMANQDATTRLMLQQMDATTRENLVNIEANYRTLMQASASAGELYQQTLTNISNITGNKDMDAAAKNAAVAQQMSLLQNGMNLLESMNNLNLSDIIGDLSGGGAAAPAPQEPIMQAPVYTSPDRTLDENNQ